MLPWYQGAYSHGFIAFHPFFKVDGLNPSACEYGTLVHSRSDCPDGVDLMEWIDGQADKRRKGKEVTDNSVAQIAKSFGHQIGWQSIREPVGFPDDRSVDRALRTHIMGLRRELEDRSAADCLTAYCKQHQIFLPTEGRFQPTMESVLVSMLERAGLSEIIIGDEFGEDEVLIPLDFLAGPVAWDTRDDLPLWGARRLIAPDHSMLVWVHWDSFYTAIFGTSERIQNSGLADSFEGFWCSNETTTYWLVDDTEAR